MRQLSDRLFRHARRSFRGSARVSALLLLLLGGCALVGPDEQRDGRVDLQWSVREQAWSTILIDGENVIFATLTGDLIALDRRTGAEVWRTSGPNAGVRDLFASWNLNLVSGLVIWSRDELVGVRAIDGSIAWTYRDSYTGLSGRGPRVADGGVFDKVGPFTFRLDSQSGSVVWRDPSAEDSSASGVNLDANARTVVLSRALTGAQDPQLVALDARNGARRWGVLPRGNLSNRPCCTDVVITDDLVVVRDSRDTLRAFDEVTGSLRWAVRSPNAAQGGNLIAVPGGVIEVQPGGVLAQIGGWVTRYDAVDGRILWSRQLQSPGVLLRGFTLQDRRLTFGLENGEIAVIDIASGKLLLEYTRRTSGIKYFISVAAIDDWLYTSDAEGKVYGLTWRP